ncbi:MAG: DUF433 domain-containing protein [Chloroflexi bacterium]|nr:DUF433 domain-containing protein [Chloroflexota bacterium]
MIDWRQHLTSDPQVCHGELCAKGTRALVTNVLDSLAGGASREAILVPCLRRGGSGFAKKLPFADAVCFCKKQAEARRAMITKSIRLTEEEAAQVRQYVEATGEVEAAVLKRAMLRGLKDIRLERGILAYLEGHGASEAAAIAGLGHAEFLWELMERGVQVLKGPSHMAKTLDRLGRELGDEKLIAAGRTLAEAEVAGAVE